MESETRLRASHGPKIPQGWIHGGTWGLAVLLACAHAPSPRAPGPAGADYFPLLPGARWVYRVRSSLGSDELEIVAHGEQPVRGSPVALFLLEERMNGEHYGLADSGWVGLFRSEGYWHRYTTIDNDPREGFRLFGSGAVRVLPVDPHHGDEWEETLYLYQNPESGGGRQHLTATIEHGGTLRTPAGTFRDVLVVRSRYWDPALFTERPVLTYEDAYARGVGLVRSRMRSHLEGGGELEQVLISVRFPAPPG